MSNNNPSEKYLSHNDLVESILDAFIKKDLDKLHSLENKTIESAIIEDDKLFAEIGVSIYGIRKLESKKHISSKPEWLNCSKKIIELYNNFLVIDNLDKKKEIIISIIASIKGTDKQLGRYVTHVIYDGRVKLASSAYAYGLSASQAALLFNADREQLMVYLGATKMSDEDKQYKSIKERVHILEVISKKGKNI